MAVVEVTMATVAEATMAKEIDSPRTDSNDSTQADPELPPGLPSPTKRSESSGDELSDMPPGLPSPTARSTKSNSDVLSPPPGLESLDPTDLLDSFMPKKIPVQSGLVEQFHNYPSGVLSSNPPSPNGGAAKKKFCVFCGMQVDPQYITAKFCAYCGVEHVKMDDDKTNEPVRTAAPSAPILSTMPQAGELQYKYDNALYDDGTGLAWSGYHGINDADYYTGAAAYAWRGMNTLVPDNMEYEEALLQGMYAPSYPLPGCPSATWPSQAMAW
jgi:hypothetical protein